MWHRTPIPDLLIAETALHHGMGVVHVDGDFDRLAEVRPLVVRRLRPSSS
jgi:predicted nucleic acid-binding protein